MTSAVVGWVLHLHIIAAIAWIGGAFFMFALGVTLRKEEHKQSVYPIVGPIYGYYEFFWLLLLVGTGIEMIYSLNLAGVLFESEQEGLVLLLQKKILFVIAVIVLTMVHTVIAIRSIRRVRTRWEFLFSKISSMGVFLLNLVILHYAIMIREIL